MSAIFPTAGWLKAFEEKLNSDEQYARIARNWEGDLAFVIESDGNLKEGVIMYLDLWHGKCRGTAIWKEMSDRKPVFVMKAPYGNFSRVLLGQLDPMQAMMTRKLQVQGNMAIMMRSVPIVLDFVRCAREITTEIL
jgi:putative sterol carrier protein